MSTYQKCIRIRIRYFYYILNESWWWLRRWKCNSFGVTGFNRKANSEYMVKEGRNYNKTQFVKYSIQYISFALDYVNWNMHSLMVAPVTIYGMYVCKYLWMSTAQLSCHYCVFLFSVVDLSLYAPAPSYNVIKFIFTYCM